MAGEGVTPTVTESDSDEFKPLPSALFAFYVPWSKRKVGKARLAKPTLQHGPKNAGAPQGKEIVQPTLQEILDENTLKQEKNVLEMHNKVREELDRLRRFPVTNSTIEFPRNEGSGNVQVEPELALHCDIVYENVNKSDSSDNSSNSNGPGNGNQISKRKVLKLIPTKIAAFNDCSIRALEGSSKLSEKKNWGFGSKGISTDYFEITCFSPTVPETGLPSLVSRLWISSYILRDGKIYSYTKPAAARSYLLFFDELLEWIVTQINDQGDVDKWEDVSELLAVSNYPSRTWIALGAGEYTDWGNENFLEKHDETAVIVYDEAIFGAEGPDFGVIEKIFLDVGTTPPGCIALHQTFV